jgi:hypothetical protein
LRGFFSEAYARSWSAMRRAPFFKSTSVLFVWILRKMNTKPAMNKKSEASATTISDSSLRSLIKAILPHQYNRNLEKLKKIK